MTKHATLKSKLHKSLSHLKPTTTKPVAAAPAAEPTNAGIARKLSVSLHPTDLARLAAIQAELAKTGHYVTLSEALKVAIRGYEPTAKTVAALHQSLKADDQRRVE